MPRISKNMDAFMAGQGYIRLFVLQILFRWGAVSTPLRWMRKHLSPQDITTVNATSWVNWEAARAAFNHDGAADVFQLPATALEAWEHARTMNAAMAADTPETNIARSKVGKPNV